MSAYLLSPIFLISISYALGLILTLEVRNLLLKRKLLDTPNQRSSHSTPVPRGGGLALLAILIPGMLILSWAHHDLSHIGIILGTILASAVSWLDDKKGVSALKRLSLHILAACIGSLSFTEDQTLFAGSLPFWADRTIMIIGWAWFMNLYNFMDGIDGITCTESISLATGVCLLLAAIGLYDPFLGSLMLILTGACLGFLALNWHPAKIFLGDVGSIPLGYILGFALLVIALHGYLLSALLLPLYYLADSGITLLKRALRREKLWEAHRQHFYQKATRDGQHDRAVLWIIITNLGLASAALTAVSYPLLGVLLAMALVAILLWKMHKTCP
ncbi:MAG: glycosyltransferase family 4 protein [Alphaproteobacteria bacterium]